MRHSNFSNQTLTGTTTAIEYNALREQFNAKTIVITDKMLETLAKELEAKIAYAKQRKDPLIPLFNTMLHIKYGSTTHDNGSFGWMKENLTVSYGMPYSASLAYKKFRVSLVSEDGHIKPFSVYKLLYIAFDAIRVFENTLNAYKKSPNNCSKFYNKIVEMYGIDDFEKRINKFWEYIDGLDKGVYDDWSRMVY